MFNNPEEKCKKLAKIIYWAITLLSTIGILVLITILGWCDGYPFLLFLMPVGILVAKFYSAIIYAFAELCENTKRILNYLENQKHTENNES